MAKDHGKTLTQLFVTSAWEVSRGLINEAFKEFTQNGWEEARDKKTGFRCLTMFDADLRGVRKAAKKNPALIFLCFTVSCETDNTTVHMGIGGAWLKKTRRLSNEIRLGSLVLADDYVRTMAGLQPASWSARQPAGKAKHRGQSSCTSPTTKPPRTRKAPKAVAAALVTNNLVFHGRPEEVERCRALVLEMLPEATRAGVEFMTEGNEQYLAGSMSFATDNEPAFRVFNKLVAQIPGVTVALEYADPKTGQRRQLRAVDGKIVGQQVP